MSKEDNYCHYSGLPSPLAYNDTMDYDGMGNHGRFPKPKQKRVTVMKRLIQRIMLWWSIRKTKRKNKSIWEI